MPTEKAKPIEDLLTELAGISRHEAERQGICTWCKKPITGFKDPASRNEYMISGFCQQCQDESFGSEYTCEYCGKKVDEKDVYFVEHHFYCSGECYGHDVGF